MREYVYLFELDSVRKTDEEIIRGQKALYDEIIVNGNVVVLTYNQLVDSRAFFSLFGNEEYQKNIINLFKNGAIRISQYGDTRSLVQYLINSVDADKEFIYSALPVKFSQKHLLALIKRSLMYSDLSEIYEFYTNKRTEDDLVGLFIEISENSNADKNQNGDESFLMKEVAAGKKSKDVALEEMRNILKNIYWLLSTVLNLSAMHDIYIHPKDSEEYRGMQLHNILDIVVDFDAPNDLLWQDAISIIKSLETYRSHNDDRSVYLREIKKLYKNKKIDETNKKGFQYAEAIVNLCYNYACEISICNISKHYNLRELALNYAGEKTTFQSDFNHRLNQDWNHGCNADARYLTDETTHFEKFIQTNRIPDFSSAVRYTEYVSYQGDILEESVIHRYEYKLDKRKRRHKGSILKSIAWKGIHALVCLILACSTEFVFNFLQDWFDAHIKLVPAIETLFFLFVTEAITSGISAQWPQFLSLSDALGRLGKLIEDGFSILCRKSNTYFNNCGKDILNIEDKSKDVTIEYILSPELRRYIRFQDTNKIQKMFDKSDVYPIADMANNSIKKKIVSLEERFNYKFGMVYRSKYNTMLVDPIDTGVVVFPYERIIPSSGKDGVVMITTYQNSFILLNQYRHATRTEQYSFPRGFAEPGLTPCENACRELEEEIGAKITKVPKLIGRVVSDSGLIGSMTYVYLVEIDAYKFNTNIHEGIEKIIEIPTEKMDQWIKNDNINDGFSLSAYALYKLKCMA